MVSRERRGGMAAFGLALLPIWVASLSLNWLTIAAMLRDSVTIVSRGVAGAWVFVLRVAVFILMPYGQAEALDYNLRGLFQPEIFGSLRPSPLFWVWILVAPVVFLVGFRWLTGHEATPRPGSAFLVLLRPAAGLAILILLGTLLSPGADSLLVLLGPLSRSAGDVNAYWRLATLKGFVVLPYLLFWVCAVAPLVAMLIPLSRRSGRRAEQTRPADGVGFEREGSGAVHR